MAGRMKGLLQRTASRQAPRQTARSSTLCRWDLPCSLCQQAVLQCNRGHPGCKSDACSGSVNFLHAWFRRFLSLPMMRSRHDAAPLVPSGLAATYALCVQERSWHPKVDLASITLEQLRRAVATAQASAQAADEAARSQQVNGLKRCGSSVLQSPACMQSGAISKCLDPNN